MAVTRLKRKAKRNKVKAKVRQESIQRLNSKPVIKSVDVEQIKEEFKKGSKGTAKADTKKADTKKEEAKAEAKAPAKEAKAEKAEEPKAEKKETKKAAPKKEDKKDKE